jgi:hypothetical protein
MIDKRDDNKSFSVFLHEYADVTAPPAFSANQAQTRDKEAQWLYYFTQHAKEVTEVLTGEDNRLCTHFIWMEENMPSFAAAMCPDGVIDEIRTGDYIALGNKTLQKLQLEGYEPAKDAHIRFKDNITLDGIAKEAHAMDVATKAGISITETLKTFKSWLHIEHDTDITIPLAYALSNFSNTDPGCMAIIAPSGSYKTELIRALGEDKNDLIYPLDNLTSHTLISGLPKVPDVIPDLQRRLITIKDFTALLSKREEERTLVFSDIREMLDGYINRSFGSGKRVTYRDIHSSLLIASTNAIESYYSLNATLGQRMIFFRPSNDPTRARERALENMNHTEQMREELQTSVKRLLSHLVTGNHRLERIGENLSKEEKDCMGAYTDFVAIARTHVKRDYKGYIAEIPEPEFPTRLFKEVVKIIECHAILFNREVCQDDLQAGLLILHHNVPRERFKLIRKLAEEPIRGFHTSELATSLNLSSYSTKQKLDELLMLKLIYRESFRGGNKGDKWRIVPAYRSVIQHFLDFEIGLAVGENMDRCTQIKRCCFISDLKTIYDNHNNNINSNTESIRKDKESSLLIRPVYTTPDLPPPLECGICKKSTPYLSYYLANAYCDKCLEDELNKINGFGNIEEGKIKSYSPVEKATCEHCGEDRFLDHECTHKGQRSLICTKCAEELKQEEDEVPKVPTGISLGDDIEYEKIGGTL